MAVKTHINMLNQQVKSLDTKIHNEQKRPLPDEDILHMLKLKRLKIQDEIQRLKK